MEAGNTQGVDPQLHLLTRLVFGGQEKQPTGPVQEMPAPSGDQVDLCVVDGDAGRVKADALIAPLNPTGCWAGAIDKVIYRNADMQFHDQVAECGSLEDGQTIVARAKSPHQGAFGDVVFVIDTPIQPLRNIIRAGLSAANAAGYAAVSLPAMRMGVMLGEVERTAGETINEMAEGVKLFLAEKPQNTKQITFVVYHDPTTQGMLSDALGLSK